MLSFLVELYVIIKMSQNTCNKRVQEIKYDILFNQCKNLQTKQFHYIC